jgi:hypothetical protein
MEAANDRADALTGVIVRNGLTIDPVAREVRLDNRLVPLTMREFDLLLFFARHRVTSSIEWSCSTRCGVTRTMGTSTRSIRISTGCGPRSKRSRRDRLASLPCGAWLQVRGRRRAAMMLRTLYSRMRWCSRSAVRVRCGIGLARLDRGEVPPAEVMQEVYRGLAANIASRVPLSAGTASSMRWTRSCACRPQSSPSIEIYVLASDGRIVARVPRDAPLANPCRAGATACVRRG